MKCFPSKLHYNDRTSKLSQPINAQANLISKIVKSVSCFLRSLIDSTYLLKSHPFPLLLKKNIPSAGLLSRLRERVLESTHLAQNIEFSKGINPSFQNSLNTNLRDGSARSTGLCLTTADITFQKI